MAVDPRALRRTPPTVDAYGGELSPAPPSWGSLSPDQQAAADTGMRSLGGRMNERLDTLKQKESTKPTSKQKLSQVSQEQIDARPIPDTMSLDQATGERLRWIGEAEDEARYRTDLETLAGTGKVHSPRGVDWYSQHHREYSKMSEETGVPTDLLIHAGTVLSPNSDPDKEVASARGVAGMVHGGVTVSPEQSQVIHDVQHKPDAQRHTNTVVPPGTHRLEDLSVEQAAMLSSTVNMAGTPTINPRTGKAVYSESFDMPDSVRLAARAGNRYHVEKALAMLRGEMSTAEANGVLTSPKMLGYSRSTQLGTPMEAERSISHARARVQDSRTGAQQLDLGWNVIDDDTTAEDSWMHGMSYRSGDLGVVKPIGSENSLGSSGALTKRPPGWKKGAPELGPDMTGVAASHAWNNEATVRAARETGYTPQATQAISWEAQRRAAGADAAYNRERAAWDAAVKAQSAPASQTLDGQGTLF